MRNTVDTLTECLGLADPNHVSVACSIVDLCRHVLQSFDSRLRAVPPDS